jgi:DNA-binding MarR family transcriptional regulator
LTPPSPEPGDGTSQLNAALGQLARVLRSFIIDHVENVSGLQLAILSKLRCDDGARLTEIAAALPCDLSVASRQAMLLVERGLAAKTRDPDDGRAQRFTLTEQGAQAIDASLQARLTWLDEQLTDFDEQQRGCAAAVLGALVPGLWHLKGKKFDADTLAPPSPTIQTNSTQHNQTEDHS